MFDVYKLQYINYITNNCSKLEDRRLILLLQLKQRSAGLGTESKSRIFISFGKQSITKESQQKHILCNSELEYCPIVS